MRLGSNTVIRETLTSQTFSVLLDGAFVSVYLAIIMLQQPAIGLLVFVIGALQIALLIGTKRRVHEVAQHELADESENRRMDLRRVASRWKPRFEDGLVLFGIRRCRRHC